MDNTIINVNDLPPVAWSNELVLTSAQLAEFYGTTVDCIRHNFSRNKEHFIEGKHFFRLKGDALKAFQGYVENLYLENSETQNLNARGLMKNFHAQNLNMTGYMNNCHAPISRATSSFILWTKRGAFRHAKSINTKRAWEIYELLENNYFDRVNHVDTKSVAPFRQEINAQPQTQQVTDFQRGVELKQLASLTRDDETRERLVCAAANFIAGRKIFDS